MINQEIRQLKPERLWHYFAEILAIPRPSKKEDKIAQWLLQTAEGMGLEAFRDAIGNVIIRKPATPGMENRPTVVLQSHMDMVCEKNADVTHDFDRDPILSRIEGEWVKASGTTLGADDGIGMAAQLALLEANDIPHGPIECLITVDEETGLTGAFGLDPNALKGRILLNLDSEDEGELFIGCAGGKDTVATLPYQVEPLEGKFDGLRISLGGLTGGHSGDDIHKGRGNAVKLMNRVLHEAIKSFDAHLISFDGGNLRNAIAREAFAIVAVPAERIKAFQYRLGELDAIFRKEYHVTEPDLWMRWEGSELPGTAIEHCTALALVRALYACAHGVIAWSADIPNFVETSTNLASVKTHPTHIEITTSQRSSVESAKDDVSNMVASVFELAGCEVRHTDGYPGWTPNPNSEITRITAEAWERLYGQKPKVLAIHAGLECGLIGEKYPGMDMISYGPTIKGAHSPDERLLIDTVERFWELTLEVLKKV
jgi:dipeptidase D